MADRIEVTDLTERDVKEFMLNPVWQCLEADIKERLKLSTEQMQLAPPEDIWGKDKEGKPVLEVTGIKRLQGMAVEDGIILDMPQSYLDEIILNKEQKEKEKE